MRSSDKERKRDKSVAQGHQKKRQDVCPASFYSLKENHLYLEVIFFIIDGVLQYQGFQGRFQGYG